VCNITCRCRPICIKRNSRYRWRSAWRCGGGGAPVGRSRGGKIIRTHKIKYIHRTGTRSRSESHTRHAAQLNFSVQWCVHDKIAYRQTSGCIPFSRTQYIYIYMRFIFSVLLLFVAREKLAAIASDRDRAYTTYFSSG